MKRTMKIDKQLSQLIPPLAEDEFKQLESNLINEGWRNNERIITWNNIIVSKKNYDEIEKVRKETQENFPDANITHDDVIENLLWN